MGTTQETAAVVLTRDEWHRLTSILDEVAVTYSNSPWKYERDVADMISDFQDRIGEQVSRQTGSGHPCERGEVVR